MSKKNNKFFLNTYSYNQVKVTDERFHNCYYYQLNYLMDISVDDMFYEKRKSLGLDTRNGKSLHNEEGSWFRNGGDVLGQWTQALARFYSAEQDERILNKIKQMMEAYSEIATHSPCLVDGLFMYYFEKYLRGFCDVYVYCGIEKAFDLAIGLINYAMDSPTFRKGEYLLGDNGPSDEIEWYTLGESINYFIDLFQEKYADGEKVEKYKEFASIFRYDDFWGIIKNGGNILDYTPISGQNTAHFHAYSHINSMNSLMSYYYRNGDETDAKIAIDFYDFMRNTQELATGGFGSHLEWLLPDTGIINAISDYHDNSETQCDSYAVYRLSNKLLALTGNAKYGQWPEKLLYNLTEASLEIDKMGHTFYYSDYCVKGGSKFRHANTWTCCTGTRPLIMTELLKNIYFYDDSALYINLFVSSSVEYKGINLQMGTKFPYSNEVRFKLSGQGKVNLKMRLPEWQSGYKVEVNGTVIQCKVADGWIIIEDVFAGSEIKIVFDFTLRLIKKQAKRVSIAAVNYGPITLAAKKGEMTTPPNINLSVPIEEQLEKAEGLTFKLKGSNIIFKPFMEFIEDEEYYMYFKNIEKRNI